MSLRIVLGTRGNSHSTDDFTYYLEQDEDSRSFSWSLSVFGLGDNHEIRRVLLHRAQDHRFYREAMKVTRERLFGGEPI
ncbi:hypothetical protein Pres01_30840 [Metapseudomonas resinovorans]|nr:hypothetical protein Pres01_30840 [Pseudomonas resinovorans]